MDFFKLFKKEKTKNETELENIMKDTVMLYTKCSKLLKECGYNADFTIESIHEVDKFIDESKNKRFDGSAGLFTQDNSMKSLYLGAYVGEVIRRNCDGKWKVKLIGDSNMDICISFKNGETFSPHEIVIKRVCHNYEKSIYETCKEKIKFI